MRLFGVVVLGVLAACGTAEFVEPPDGQVRPPCANPSPLLGQFDPRAPGFIVVYRAGVDGQQETDRLARRYGFQPRFVYMHALQGFSAMLEPSVVAGVRCEASVAYVDYDGRVSIDAGAASF
jgi:hypothetical protein